MAGNANSDGEAQTFECTGCGYQFPALQPATRVIIKCPNCPGESLALPRAEILKRQQELR